VRTVPADGAGLTVAGRIPGLRRSYRGLVRLTEFWNRMEARFGRAYARSYAADQVLSTLDGRTVEQALADGADAKQVWRAVCDAEDVPASER
jgi:hypothetical protein